jgi:hypothetical protein
LVLGNLLVTRWRHVRLNARHHLLLSIAIVLRRHVRLDTGHYLLLGIGIALRRHVRLNAGHHLLLSIAIALGRHARLDCLVEKSLFLLSKIRLVSPIIFLGCLVLVVVPTIVVADDGIFIIFGLTPFLSIKA